MLGLKLCSRYWVNRKEYVIKKYFVAALFLLSATGYGAIDPTTPPDFNSQEAPSHTPKNIVLSGIFISADKSTAIINKKTVTTGDFIEGYEVIKIDKNSVYLKNNRGNYVVPLDASVLTPVTDEKNQDKGFQKNGIKD